MKKMRLRLPRWRKMTWVVILWCALILVWAIAGASHHAASCTNKELLSAKSCEEAVNVGKGIGVAIVLFIGFIGFVFFSLIWFMTRPKKRDCPACGYSVKKGITVCSNCKYDFAKISVTGM
jgi:predicted nucleic acid-binding Zn ribbon protein